MTLEPTPRLRWIERRGERVLQQWWAPPMPGYLRDDSVGEWRDVPFGVEAP